MAATIYNVNNNRLLRFAVCSRIQAERPVDVIIYRNSSCWLSACLFFSLPLHFCFKNCEWLYTYPSTHPSVTFGDPKTLWSSEWCPSPKLHKCTIGQLNMRDRWALGKVMLDVSLCKFIPLNLKGKRSYDHVYSFIFINSHINSFLIITSLDYRESFYNKYKYNIKIRIINKITHKYK